MQLHRLRSRLIIRGMMSICRRLINIIGLQKINHQKHHLLLQEVISVTLGSRHLLILIIGIKIINEKYSPIFRDVKEFFLSGDYTTFCEDIILLKISRLHSISVSPMTIVALSIS